MTIVQSSRWKLEALDELAHVGAGNPAPQDKKLFEGGKYPFIRTSDVGQIRFGEISTAADLLNEQGVARLRLVPKGTVLMPKSGASTFLNHRVMTTADAFVSSHLATITPRDGITDPRFLLYALSQVSAQDLLPENSYPSLNLNLIKTIKIPLPTLEEQQQIAAVLDEAFEGLARARAHADANLQNARELFENFLGALFTRNDVDWISAPLQEIVESDCSLSYGIVQPGDDVSGGLPIVRPTDLGPRIITLDGLKRIDPAKADGYARTKLKGTEILLCVRGSTGVVAMASEELGGANVTRGIVPIRFDPEKMDQRLGYYQFLSKPVQDQIKAGTYGAALMQINIRDLRKLAFTIPPLSEQEVLLERLDSVANDFDTLIEDYTRKVSDIDDLRQSLLQKAFTGELT